jgi:hypothetical protein
MDISHFSGLAWPPALSCVALVAAFGLCDRLWGAAHPHFKGKKALILLLVLGLPTLFGGWFLTAMGAVWFVARSIPFAHGSLTPVGALSIAFAALKHSVPALAAYGMWRAWQFGGMDHVWPLAVYAAAATTIGLVYGRMNRSGRIGPMGWLSEVLRGGCYGAALGAGLQPLSATLALVNL